MRIPTAPFDVIKVVDTRDFIEVDDRFVAVAGSGDARPCDRCDRLHEIHAHVVDADGIGWVVGTGCMDAEANDVARSAARAATNEAKKAARRARAEALVAELAAAEAAVAELPFPAERVVETIEPHERGNGWVSGGWSVDGASVWGIGLRPGMTRADFDDAYDWENYTSAGKLDVAERLACLESVWRTERLVELFDGDVRRLNKTRREAAWLDRNPAPREETP